MYGGPSGRGMRGGGVVVEDATGDLKVSNILHHQDLQSTNLEIIASSSTNTLHKTVTCILQTEYFQPNVCTHKYGPTMYFTFGASFYCRVLENHGQRMLLLTCFLPSTTAPKARIQHCLCIMQVEDYLLLEASVAQPGDSDFDGECVLSKCHHATQLYSKYLLLFF